jgi:hypothetical protein
VLLQAGSIQPTNSRRDCYPEGQSYRQKVSDLARPVEGGRKPTSFVAPGPRGREVRLKPDPTTRAVAFMLLVGVLASLGPARRGLRIDPTEALRSE